MIALNIFIWVIVAYFFSRQKSATIYSPFFWYLIFHLVIFILRPIIVDYYEISTMWKYMRFQPNANHIDRFHLTVGIGLLFHSFGYFYATRNAIKLKFTDFTITKTQKNYLYIVIILLAPLAIYSASQRLNMVGEMVGGIYIMAEGNGYLYELQTMCGPIFVLFWFAMQRKIWALLPFLCFISYRLYLGSGRFAIVLNIVFLLMILAYALRIRFPKISPKTIAIIILGIFGYTIFDKVGENRQFFRDWTGSAEEQIKYADEPNFLETAASKMDFGNYEFLTYVVATVPEETKTYNYGIQYLQLFYEPLPRKLFPWKPIGAISNIALNNYGNFIGLTVSMVGDAWITGGYTGIILIMAFFGYLSGAFYRKFCTGKWSIFGIIAFICFTSYSAQWYRDGGIVTIVKFMFFALTPILFWWAITKCFSPVSIKRKITSTK